MTTNGTAKTSHLFTGLVLGAIGGVIAAIFSRKETRDALRERSHERLDYLNQQAGKLRDRADEIVTQSKEFIGPGCEPVKSITNCAKLADQEDQRSSS